MKLKYKLIILALVFLAVFFILLTSGTVPDHRVELSESEEAETVFKPNEEPYMNYLEARQANRPIFLEFYARW